MSRAYTVRQGDTFSSISRRMYGDEQYSSNIAEANPGIGAQPQIGTSIVIPDVPDLALPSERARNANLTQDRDEVTLSVNGSVLRFWTAVTITQHLDAVSTVSFRAPFDPTDRAQREAFRPYGYQPVRIDVGGDLLFTGTEVNPQPTTEESQRAVRVQCYSTPGVLSDSTPPASAYPLQWDEASLRTIAADLCRPFGIQVLFPDGGGSVFERIAVDPGEKVMNALARLASQRNLVIRSDEAGRLVFLRPSPTPSGEPVAEFIEGEQPLVSAVPSFGNQQFYSHVSGISPTILGLVGPQVTVRNPHLNGILRPYVYTADDMEAVDLQVAVMSKAGRMFADSATYAVPVPTWRNANGDLWRVGDLVVLDAPGAMVYGRFTMQIRSIRFTATAAKRTAVLELIIPGTLSGELPEALPWDDSRL
ncbi:LysM domain protein [Vibrio phage 1.009.O._10N.261.51.C9]|nr:LysM domain protein [Vibrio phage 1.009.O._10N.261.51.C9]